MENNRVTLFLLASIVLVAAKIPREFARNFTDPRDAKTYGLVTVGDDIWMAEDLRYKSNDVHLHLRKKGGDTLFLYGLEERENVCPVPFHLMRKEELDRALTTLYGLPSAEMDTMSWSDPLLFHYHNADSLFASESGLGFQKKGWVQGKRYRKKASRNTIHLWVDHNDDERYHLHMADTNAFIHAHDHHLKGAPRKQRKFSVRCVCERDSLLNYFN